MYASKGEYNVECLINDLPVYYEEYGIGKPVLCLHGFMEDHRVMIGCLEPFFQNTKGYRRIYLDLPGMGKTPSRDWVENADIMLSILKEFANKIIGDESFLLVGLSYGGYMALGMVFDSHMKIDGIFLMCPCVITEYSKRNLPVKNDIAIEQGLESVIKSTDDFSDFISMAVVATRETWHRFENEVLPGFKMADKNFVSNFRKNGYGFTFENQLKELEFTNPVCILTGKQDDGVGYEDTWELLKHLPRLTFTVLDNAGHLLQIENEEIFNVHLSGWLKRIKEVEFL